MTAFFFQNQTVLQRIGVFLCEKGSETVSSSVSRRMNFSVPVGLISSFWLCHRTQRPKTLILSSQVLLLFPDGDRSLAGCSWHLHVSGHNSWINPFLKVKLLGTLFIQVILLGELFIWALCSFMLHFTFMEIRSPFQKCWLKKYLQGFLMRSVFLKVCFPLSSLQRGHYKALNGCML